MAFDVVLGLFILLATVLHQVSKYIFKAYFACLNKLAAKKED